MNRGSHPTRERLIDTMVRLLDEKGAEHISVDEVLTTSGISKGSLYHHFEDFGDLVEVALIRRFVAWGDTSVHAMADAINGASTRDEMLESLAGLTRRTNSPELAPVRLERIRAIGMTGANPRFAARLATEQKRLTDAFTDVVREAQHKGLIASTYSPDVIAVFIQAYTFGRVLDEISEEHVDTSQWNALIANVVSHI